MAFARQGRKKQLKVYGTRRKGHREHWTVKGKGKYFWVRRDSKRVCVLFHKQ